MNRVVHFEIYVDEPAETMAFYREVFDWSFEPFAESPGEYWSISTGGEGEQGIDGGLMQWEPEEWGERQTGWGFLCTVEVESVDDTLQRVTDAGGTVEVAKMEIPGVGWQAYCADPDGNQFSVMEMAME